MVVEVDNDRAITLAQTGRDPRTSSGMNWVRRRMSWSCRCPARGMGRPFKVPRQYVKHTGRMVSVQLHDGRTVEGRLEGVRSEVLQVRRQVPSKVKAGRQMGGGCSHDPRPRSQSTKASITFN